MIWSIYFLAQASEGLVQSNMQTNLVILFFYNEEYEWERSLFAYS